MTDDIVTRLRAYDIGSVAQESEYHMTEVLAEAADEIEGLREKIQDLRMYAEQDSCEIERLRAARDKWELLAHKLYECATDPCTPNHSCDACRSPRDYEKAVRGE